MQKYKQTTTLIAAGVYFVFCSGKLRSFPQNREWRKFQHQTCMRAGEATLHGVGCVFPTTSMKFVQKKHKSASPRFVPTTAKWPGQKANLFVQKSFGKGHGCGRAPRTLQQKTVNTGTWLVPHNLFVVFYHCLLRLPTVYPIINCPEHYHCVWARSIVPYFLQVNHRTSLTARARRVCTTQLFRKWQRPKILSMENQLSSCMANTTCSRTVAY